MKPWILGTVRICFGITLLALAASARPADVLFSTAFETAEEYDANSDLTGQNGWLKSGGGGNGLTTWFPGEGQQAYIGFSGPADSSTNLNVWKPIGFDPLTNGKPRITFKTIMAITDSTTADPGKDIFCWAVFSSAGEQLFIFEFNNSTKGICYWLQGDTSPRATGFVFENDVIYDLEIRMNFVTGQWTATMNGADIVANQPMAITSARRDFGDATAGWLFGNPANPGDNYMAFDKYTVLADIDAPVPPTLRLLSVASGNNALVEVSGEPNRVYVVDASTNLTDWVAVETNQPTNGIFEFPDTGASGLSHRFYRARIP
jgi:hypothetical protein